MNVNDKQMPIEYDNLLRDFQDLRKEKDALYEEILEKERVIGNKFCYECELERRIKELEDKNRKLRYERLMWKAKYFKEGFGYVQWIHAKTKKSKAKYDAQAFRIGQSLEERAKKLKEGK